MTRKTTWTNSDGLVVGFGPNFAERNEAGVVKTSGGEKEARLQLSYQSSGANIAVPAGSVIKSVTLKVGDAWTGGTKLEVGDGTDADGFISATQGAQASLTAGVTIDAGGAYVIAAAGTTPDVNVPKLNKVYAAADTIDVTLTGTFTAGTATLIVTYL